MNSFEKYSWLFFLIWYACGYILLIFVGLPSWLEWANVVFLMASGVIGIFYFQRILGKIKGLIFASIVFILSMFTEGFGVYSGSFFGEYYYTDNFGIQLFGVPIAIGFAWIMVIATTSSMSQLLFLFPRSASRILYILFGALLSVGMDLILDPVSFQVKSYWIWTESGIYYDIPLQNFVGWFILAAVFHGFYCLFMPKFVTISMDYLKVLLVEFALIYFLFATIAFTSHLYFAIACSFLWIVLTLSILIFLYLKESKSFQYLFNEYLENLFKRSFQFGEIYDPFHQLDDIQSRPVLFVLNHHSWWDALLVFYMNRHIIKKESIAIMGNEGLTRYPFFKKLGAIPIDSNSVSSIKNVKKEMKNTWAKNGAVWIFPQGKEEPYDIESFQLYDGTSFFVQEESIDVVPIIMHTGFSHHRLPEVRIMIGKKFTFESSLSRTDKTRIIEVNMESTRELLDHIRLTEKTSAEQILWRRKDRKRSSS